MGVEQTAMLRTLSRTTPSSTRLLRRTFVLDAHHQELDTSIAFNPEWTPGGDEGGVDTNALPWLPVPQLPGCALKPLRVSDETGAFTAMIKVDAGTTLPTHVHLGASDMFVLSGEMEFSQGPMKGKIGAGTWGYSPAGVLMEGNTATEDTEYLASFYGPVAFLNGADFFITSGRIGYRAGPKEGSGPGTYMYEPAGARHEATQRVTDDDLIYTANVWGPICFDSGPGTPPTAVLSWMQYLE